MNFYRLIWFFRKLYAKFSGKIVPRDENDYQALSAISALQHCNVKGKKVLVIGCNRGEDCQYFLQSGAKEIHGVDIMDSIGSNLQHKKIQYHQCSAEDMQCFSGNTFDLVYAVATLEHIPDIEAAFNEMHRVCKPGGIIYSLAAPLWNSRFGHHKANLFEDYPWIHLLLNRDEIVDWFIKNNTQVMADKSTSIEHHVNYMLNKNYINMRPAKDYLAACDKLDVQIIYNEIIYERETVLTAEAKERLLDTYGKKELLGITHRFIARKNSI